MDVLEPFEHLNHVVNMDKFFTSGPLVDELAKHDIFVAGTIQQTAQGFPSELKGLKLPVGQFAGVSTGETSYHTFKDRKMVSFVSNAFPVAMKGRVARLPPNQKVLRYQQVPPVLPAYSKFMGAVDRCNHLRKSYGYDRKSKRYWVRPFMNFFDLAVTNAYILYKHNCVLYDIKLVDQFKFRLEITRSLLRKGKWARTRTKAGVEGTVDTEERCCLVQVSAIGLKRGRCFHCTQVKRPKIGSTSFGCSNCRVRLCKTKCFAAFHRDHD